MNFHISYGVFSRCYISFHEATGFLDIPCPRLKMLLHYFRDRALVYGKNPLSRKQTDYARRRLIRMADIIARTDTRTSIKAQLTKLTPIALNQNIFVMRGA